MSPNRFQRIVTPEQRYTEAESKGQFRRKLSAIFSADVQGYSRLMGSDEEMTVKTIIDYRDLISRIIYYHGGRVVDSPGDNILAEFANPIDALQGSIEIQRQLKERNKDLSKKHRMNFRIGLNYGDIIEEEGRLYGDGVNIAARLESLAEGGGICISGSIYEKIKGQVPVKVAYLGAKSVKNISKKIPTYKIIMHTGLSAVKHELKIISAPLIMTAFLYLMYLHHLRYLASDSNFLPYLILNPLSLVKAYLPFFIVLWLIIIAFVIYVHIKKGVSTLVLKILKGCAFYCLGYVIFYFPASHIPTDYSMGISSELYNSNYHFAELLEDSVNVYSKPRSDSDVLLQLNRSSVVRVNKTVKTTYNVWHQGQFEAENSGWMKLKLPSVKDQPEKILLKSSMYSFRIIDLASVIIGLLLFVRGFRSGST